MRKFRKTIFYLTICFAVIAFLGLVTLLFSAKDFADTMFDCIMLLISAASIAIAIMSQIYADKAQRRLDRMISELNDINKKTEEDLKTDEGLRRKLEKILVLEEEIYHRVGGRKDIKKIQKASAKKGE